MRTIPFLPAPAGSRNPCEICGESDAEIFDGEAGLCSSCWATCAHEALKEAGLGELCCRPLWKNGRCVGICVEDYGAEHDHHEHGVQIMPKAKKKAPLVYSTFVTRACIVERMLAHLPDGAAWDALCNALMGRRVRR